MTNEELVKLIQSNQERQRNLEQLYLQNRSLINLVVRSLGGASDKEDLKQEAFFGLLKAAEEWSAEGGASFSTYAFTVIRRYLQRYLNGSDLLHIPEYKGSLFWKYMQFENEIKKNLGRKPSDQEIMKELELSEDQLEALKLQLRQADLLSLNGTIKLEDDEIPLIDVIEDPEALKPFEKVEDDIFQDQLSKALYQAVSKLKERQCAVITEHYLEQKPLKEICEDHGWNNEQIASATKKEGLRELRRRFSNQLRPFMDEYAYSRGLKHTGLSYFKNNRTSSTEDAAIKLYYKEKTALNRLKSSAKSKCD